VPFAGAMIGASSNAAMLYSLGYAACRFYEAKLDSPTSVTTDATLAALKQQRKLSGNSDRSRSGDGSNFGSHALAGHPEKSWSEIIQNYKRISVQLPEGDRQQHQISL